MDKHLSKQTSIDTQIIREAIRAKKIDVKYSKKQRSAAKSSGVQQKIAECSEKQWSAAKDSGVQ
ncbi:MAG TPA: hypothetical protein IAA34_06230 [Candidatus Enterococcus stercoripullorum]|nr:hypothetical protein [Candidatus Enterococcus stercoripullorum]